MLRIEISNDGTARPTADVGNYNVVVLIDYRVVWRGRVENFNRHLGWKELVGLLYKTVTERI